MNRRIAALLLTAVIITISTRAQSPKPVVIQAISPADAAAAQPVAANPAPVVDSSATILRTLQQMKAANEAILAKQAATLQQLEDIDKAAEQLRIYNKRG